MNKEELIKEIDELTVKIDKFTEELDKQIKRANLINKVLATTVGILYFLIFFSFIQISCQIFPQMKTLPICVVK